MIWQEWTTARWEAWITAEMMSMDGADLPDSGTSSAPMDHSSMAGMDHSRMAGMPGMQSHPASETDNPLVDMQAMSVSPKLNDPGIGLRNNGRKVLTYADLKSRFEDPDGRTRRTIELHLTGHMEKFAGHLTESSFQMPHRCC